MLTANSIFDKCVALFKLPDGENYLRTKKGNNITIHPHEVSIEQTSAGYIFGTYAGNWIVNEKRIINIDDDQFFTEKDFLESLTEWVFMNW